MDTNNEFWFQDEINKTEHMKRISNVIEIKQYLLRLHKVYSAKILSSKRKHIQPLKLF